MEIEKIFEKFKDIILSEIREEFKLFKAEVRGELAGYRLAIESLSARIGNIESDIREMRTTFNAKFEEINKRIDETNKRIDETNKRIEAVNNELSRRIDETNKRIDETNKRIEAVNNDFSKKIDELRVELKQEIMLNTHRIDENNQRIDSLMLEVADIKGDLKRAFEDRIIRDDIIKRIQNLEEKVFA